jgi:hypothetical protein
MNSFPLSKDGRSPEKTSTPLFGSSLTLVVNDPVFESDAAAHRPSSADSPTPLS